MQAGRSAGLPASFLSGPVRLRWAGPARVPLPWPYSAPPVNADRQPLEGPPPGPSPPGGPGGPGAALVTLAAELRGEGPLIAPHVTDAVPDPGLGLLAAAAPRCAADPEAYASVIETVREGYLLHYRRSRLLVGADPDLRLLLGDHLYARAIERLAGLADLTAVSELADLISLLASLHAGSEPAPASIAVAWLASTVAVGLGPDESHERGKQALRGAADAGPLWSAARIRATAAGLDQPLARACEAVGFPPSDLG